MNDIMTIQNIKEERAGRSMTAELERLWLLSALDDGLVDIEAGRVIDADGAFFEGLRACLKEKGNSNASRA